jgi:aldose 1-epimerase
MSMSWLVATVALSWSAAGAAAEVRAAPYGVTRDGVPVKAYTLINNSGASVTILEYGAGIAAIRVPDRNGVLGNVVMSFANLGMWESLGWAAVIGRYANRIEHGFTIDGVKYTLSEDARGFTMHGGSVGFAKRVWTTQPVRRRDGASVTMTLLSADGDMGFPGNLRATVKYTLTNDNALREDFTATTDKPTVVNLTNHVYFNLSGNSTVPVLDHLYEVMTDQVASATPGTLAESVIGTPLDFTRPGRLGDRLAIGVGPQFDDAATAPPNPPGMTRFFNVPYLLHPGDNRLDRVAARLTDPATGRILELRTTEISLHTATMTKLAPEMLSDVGKPFTRVPAMAIETQHPPNSPNRPEFPSTILRPGQTFHSTTIFAFKTDAKRGAE